MVECKCATNPIALEAVRNDVNAMIVGFIESYGERCTPLMEIAISEYVARMVHLLVMMEEVDENPDSESPRSMTRDRETFQRVEDRLKKLVSGIQPVIARAMADVERERNGARN